MRMSQPFKAMPAAFWERQMGSQAFLGQAQYFGVTSEYKWVIIDKYKHYDIMTRFVFSKKLCFHGWNVWYCCRKSGCREQRERQESNSGRGVRVLGLYSVWSTIPKWFSVSVYSPSYEWTCVSLCICEAGHTGRRFHLGLKYTAMLH